MAVRSTARLIKAFKISYGCSYRGLYSDRTALLLSLTGFTACTDKAVKVPVFTAM
jgi:hypothetical protein